MSVDLDIAEQVRGHGQRNGSLLESLAVKGVPLDEPRSIELHFWANGRSSAAQLGLELYKLRHLVLRIQPTSTHEDPNLWNVEAGAKLSPNQVAAERFTTELVEMAARLSASYDGWGTSV